MLKPKARLYAAGKAMFRRIRIDKGWGGPYGQNRIPARWACIDCGHQVNGSDDKPWVQWHDSLGEWVDLCARNGHAPCEACGKQLPRLNDGCPRQHRWNECPGKTEADRMQPQHADRGHRARPTC